jgi:hypothetical protein
MLKPQISNFIWGILFGIFTTIIICGATLKYIPSPQEMFGSPITDCGQSAIQTQEKAASGEKSTRENVPVFQNQKSDNLKNKSNDQKNEYDCLVAKYTGNLASFTRWLVGATFLLACFGLCQVIISRNTARRQLRAYVFAEAVIDLKSGDPPGTQVKITIIISNSGLTPAYDFRLISNGKIFKPGETINFILGIQPKYTSHAALGPGSMAHNTFLLQPIHIQQTLFIFGEATYRDAFNKPRSTKFRFVSGGDYGWPDSGGRMLVCDEGNDAN